jgi:hypothetical protein
MVDDAKAKQVIDEAVRAKKERERGYREQSLKLHPWICGRCGKEFERKNLHLLTVHHKDHNHDNNPPDGSNWENLCVYCHDNEHQRYEEQAAHGGGVEREQQSYSTYNPFAQLASRKKMSE